ncbi:MAG: isoprenyl transferase [Capsulimonadales bacterium]|nr:isoprenyl transferase [Capsulimonadales bacterium]
MNAILPAPMENGNYTPVRDVRTDVRTEPTDEELLARLDPARMPRHIAIICDGNGRWATKRGMPRPFGHRQGYLSTRKVVRAASDIGIPVLTLYAFSTENWTRPKLETDALMRLFEEGARRELDELDRNNVRMRFSGRIHELPNFLQDRLLENVERTRHNTGMILNICLNYSGRAEIVDTVKSLVEKAGRREISPEDITPELISQNLYTGGLPDPDLLIRTAGEMRVSNYLLWQIAYAELYVTGALWPDFDKRLLLEAIADFQKRTRRFGGVVETK